MNKRLVACAAQAVAVVVAVVAGFPAAASTAGTTSGASTRTAGLSCDFSALGGPAAVQEPSVTLSVPAAGTAGAPVAATFHVLAMSVPAAAAPSLAGVTSYQLELSGVDATDPDGTVLKVGGDGATQPATSAGQIPAISGLPSAVFLHPGTGHLTGPVSFTLTPSTTDGPKPAITCTTTRVAPVDVTVTAARAGQVPASSGEYFCQAFLEQEPYGSDTARLPLMISVTGSNPLNATGSLHLTRAGTVTLHLPAEFVQTFSLDGPPGQDSGTHVCKLLTLRAPTGLVLHVTVAGPAPTPSQSPHSGGSAAAHGAVPAGAPGTGGGHGPGRMGLLPALAGAVLLLAGGAVVAVAVRRRGVTGP
jgi:hypothetical protein